MSTQPRRHFIFGAIFALATIGALGCSDSGDNGGGGGTGGSVTITAPGIVGPQGTLPANPPTLTVTNVTVTSGGAPMYMFQVASDQAFSNVVRQISAVTQGSGQTSWTLGTRLADGTYFWRARAMAGGVNGPYSAVVQIVAGPGGGGGGAPPPSGGNVIVSDPLTDGTTLGERFGGTLTPQGWRINRNSDSLRYSVPTITNGFVQWENIGLTPRGANDASHMLFGMWDPEAGSYRENAFRVHVQKLWNNPHNPPFMRLRWISQGRLHDAGAGFTSWDPLAVYTFRVEWGPTGTANRASVFLNDQQMMSIVYNRTYAPRTHFIEFGILERGESVIDAVYRNVQIGTR